MVQLTLTAAGKAAVDEYCILNKSMGHDQQTCERLSRLQPGSPIEHNDLVDISQFLVDSSRGDEQTTSRKWRLDTLLKGAVVYQPPPTPKPEPVSRNVLLE